MAVSVKEDFQTTWIIAGHMKAD
jgi:hypothetical protein